MSGPPSGRVLVIGGGTMGTGIAACLAAAGIETVLQIRRSGMVRETLEVSRRRIRQLVELGVASGEITPAISVVAEETRGPFVLAIESVPEDFDAKHRALAAAEAAVGEHGIVTTNTSSLSLAELARPLTRPERFAGWHWFNPAELVQLVEVVGTPATESTVLRQLTDLSRFLHKEPVALAHETPGFVANRLQYALIREAYALLESGVCSAEDIDRAVVAGLGARWAAIGPLASMDAAGLDVHETVAERLFPQLSRATSPPSLLRESRARGDLGVKSGRGLRGDYRPDAAARMAAHRDAILAALARARQRGDGREL